MTGINLIEEVKKHRATKEDEKLSFEDYKELCNQAKKEGRTLSIKEYHNCKESLKSALYASELGVAPKEKLDIAFPKFKQINALDNIQDKHKAWLEDYVGKHYSIAVQGTHLMKWQTEPKEYNSKRWDPKINMIKELGNRTRIEFDGDADKAKEDLAKTETKLRELGIGFIKSTHLGKSPYLWVEFTRNLKPSEKEAFLKWIAPEGSQVDINFASHEKVFAVLYATHWRHSYQREMPIDYFEGNKIDYDSLGIVAVKGTSKRVTGKDGFEYDTFVKSTNFNKASQIFTLGAQTKVFSEIQPLFYDKNGMWWLWHAEEYKWQIVDEVDILNMIGDATGEDIISPKNRTIILNSLKQTGRRKVPKAIKPTWIQFKSEIFDILTGERFPATSEYFVTNPLPWDLHKDNIEATPNMDRIFEEWVGKDYVRTLYEILAYCMMPDYPINRMFCFIGSGMNGKSKFLELLRKFIGGENCCTTELDTLLVSRFEITRLHKKLVCMMGETNFNEMSKTSILKKLTGGDTVGFEYKNKNPFDEVNYAKILIATNNLPSTTDKTDGFYRRWMIIDFPNRFSEKKDILAEIPEEEYNALALKCCFILKEVINARAFTNEGSIEDRMNKYEAKSNFLEKFIKEMTEENLNGYITKADFYKRFCEWSKEHKHRDMSEMSVAMTMKKMNIESEKKYFQWLFDGKGGQLRVWTGISWKS
jgi:P4 family phage/plasmid primase-like protien